MNRVFLWAVLTLGVIAFVGLQGTAQATVICEHLGATVPTTEGFTQYNPSAAYQAGGSEFGVDCWAIYNASPADSECNFAISPTEAAAMATDGWKLTVKAYDWWASPNHTANAVAFEAVTPSKIFRVCLGTEGDSGGGLQTPYVLTSGGTYNAVGTALSNAWHTYTISAGPGAASASLSIDGGAPVTMEGLSGTWAPSVNFGSFSVTTGYGEFAQVRLESGVVPEPSSVVLLVSAMLGLVAYAWRKRR